MHAFARVTMCVCMGGGGGVGAIKQGGGGAPLSGEGGGICPKCPPYGDATAHTNERNHRTLQSCQIFINEPKCFEK